MVSPFFVLTTYIETRHQKTNITIIILIITTYPHKTSHTHITIPGSIPYIHKDILNQKHHYLIYLIPQNIRHLRRTLILTHLSLLPPHTHYHKTSHARLSLTPSSPLDIYPLQEHPATHFQLYGGEALPFAASAQDTLRSAHHHLPLRARDHRHLKKDKKRDTRCPIMTQMSRFLMLFVALGYSELSSSVANQKWAFTT